MAGQDNPFPDLGGLTFSEDVFFRLLDDFLSAGVVGAASDYQVIQNHLGANMSVDVNPGSGYVPITNGGKRRTRLPAQSNSGIPGTPNSADNWTTTFVTADPTNPRIDRVVLTAQDSSVDGSGFFRSILRVVAGTPTSGATLVNLNGAAAVPVNSILLANVLVPNSATTVITANISDQRPVTKLGAGNAAINANPPVTYRKVTPKAVNTTIAPTDLLNAEILIAAGALSATGMLRFRAWGDCLQNTGAAAAPARFQLKLGATTLFDTGVNTLCSPNNSATRGGWVFAMTLNAASATNSQTAECDFWISYPLWNTTNNTPSGLFTTGLGSLNAMTIIGSFGNWSGKAVNTSAEDMTLAKALVLNVINGANNALYETRLLGALIEII